MAHLEALLFERKPATQRYFGGNKQGSAFLDSDGLCIAATEGKHQKTMTAVPRDCGDERQEMTV
jgi:hypothetical protein